MINFCTLFDSYYLDKGLALYQSLLNQTEDFTLYIFCFDEKSYDVLSDLNLTHAVILRNLVVEDDTMRRLQKERSKAEYCWTCTPVIIEYVLKHFPVDSCTYIDADLYFFSDPHILMQEIQEAKANVVITEHRFDMETKKGQRLCKRSGKYCVEFNYFDKTPNAFEALNWWKEKCIEWCYHLYEPERMGDQKYLEKFPGMFKGVHELQHLGGGVAPWNLNQYRLKEKNNEKIILTNRKTKESFPVVFYHFQNLRYLSGNLVNVSSETHSKPLKDALYIPYLKEIERQREMLKQYGVTFSVKKKYSSNPLIAFLQGSVLRFRIKSLTDLYSLEHIRNL